MDERREADERAEEHAEAKEARAGGKKKGQGLVLWLIFGCLGVGCLSFVLLMIAAIVVPSLLGHPIKSNQTAAVADLRAIAAGQRIYRRTDPDGAGRQTYAAHYRDLYYAKDAGGQPIMVLDQALADASADASPCFPKSGYIFADLKGDFTGAPYAPTVAWGVVAYPAAYNKSGHMTLIINETGTVYQKDRGAGAPPPVNFPDVAAEGWMPVH